MFFNRTRDSTNCKIQCSRTVERLDIYTCKCMHLYSFKIYRFFFIIVIYKNGDIIMLL